MGISGGFFGFTKANGENVIWVVEGSGVVSHKIENNSLKFEAKA